MPGVGTVGLSTFPGKRAGRRPFFSAQCSTVFFTPGVTGSEPSSSNSIKQPPE